MSVLRIGSLVPYLTNNNVKWRPQDHVSTKLVKVVKGKPFNGYVRYLGINYTDKNCQPLVSILLKRLVDFGLSTMVRGPINIVPIPNSRMALGTGINHPIVTLANLLARYYSPGATVEPILWWDRPRNPSHDSKIARSPELYEPHLRLSKIPSGQIVLFDDVITTGSQMIAASRIIFRATGRLPVCGIAFGRSTWSQEIHESSFEVAAHNVFPFFQRIGP